MSAMGTLNQYREFVKQIIKKHNQYKPSYGEIEQYTIFDELGDRYLLMSTRWHKHYRMYGCLIHIDIKDGKIWIQYNGTETGVAKELLEFGVPKQDIVLAFHSPAARKHTEFAVG